MAAFPWSKVRYRTPCVIEKSSYICLTFVRYVIQVCINLSMTRDCTPGLVFRTKHFCLVVRAFGPRGRIEAHLFLFIQD